MIKWPWKEKVSPAPLPWQQALASPIFASLQPDEEQTLVQLAQRFLQHKRLVPLAGLELDALHHARIALLFCLPVLKLGLE